VGHGRNVDDTAEVAFRSNLAGKQRVVVEPVVEDHGGLAAAPCRLLQQRATFDEVLLADGLLSVPRTERLFQEQALGVMLQHGHRRVAPIHFAREDEDGVWAPGDQLRRGAEHLATEAFGAGCCTRGSSVIIG